MLNSSGPLPVFLIRESVMSLSRPPQAETAIARVKTKIADGWKVRYKDGAWKLRGVEPKDIEPFLKAGTQVWWKKDGEKYKALVKETRGKDMFIKFRRDDHNYQTTVPETELIPR